MEHVSDLFRRHAFGNSNQNLPLSFAQSRLSRLFRRSNEVFQAIEACNADDLNGEAMLVQLGAAVRGTTKPAHSNRALRAGHRHNKRLWNTILLSSPKPIGILGIERGSVVPEEGFYDPHTMPEHRAIVKVALIHMLCKHPWGACPQSPLFAWQNRVGKTEYAEGIE